MTKSWTKSEIQEIIRKRQQENKDWVPEVCERLEVPPEELPDYCWYSMAKPEPFKEWKHSQKHRSVGRPFQPPRQVEPWKPLEERKSEYLYRKRYRPPWRKEWTPPKRPGRWYHFQGKVSAMLRRKGWLIREVEVNRKHLPQLDELPPQNWIDWIS